MIFDKIAKPLCNYLCLSAHTSVSNAIVISRMTQRGSYTYILLPDNICGRKDWKLPLVSLTLLPFVLVPTARLGKRACIVNPKMISMSDTVAVMTGAMTVEQVPAECLA